MSELQNEKIIDAKLLTIAPDAILENMDITEKLMLIRELSLTEEQRKKEKEEAISIEQALEEAGLTLEDLQEYDYIEKSLDEADIEADNPNAKYYTQEELITKVRSDLDG